MNIKKILSGVAVSSVMLGSMVVQAFAAPQTTLNWGSQINSSQCPNGNLVINVTQKALNDGDTRVGSGFWAMDNFNRTIKVWQIAYNTYCATVSYKGQFVSLGGVSPEGAGTIGVGVTGTVEGGYRSTIFTGTLNPNPTFDGSNLPTNGSLGTIDYQCQPNDPGDYSTCSNLFDWVSTYFSSTSGFDFAWWGWIYHGGNNGTWVNALSGNLGDITGN